MVFFWMFAFVYGFATCLVWNKSPTVGFNNNTDIIFTNTGKSIIHCAIQCTSDKKCESFEYAESVKRCTSLLVPSQSGPFAPINYIFHYSKSTYHGCSTGYDYLPNINSCVKLYSNYLSWNDSRSACISDGDNLPVLNTNILYDEFRNYMDNVVNTGDRVSVNGYVVNRIGYWATGGAVNASNFCTNTPDLPNQPNACLFFAHKSEAWCGSSVNRLDDALCSATAFFICMKTL